MHALDGTLQASFGQLSFYHHHTESQLLADALALFNGDDSVINATVSAEQKAKLLFLAPAGAPMVQRVCAGIEQHYDVLLASEVQDAVDLVNATHPVTGFAEHKFTAVLIKMSEGTWGSEVFEAVRAKNRGSEVFLGVYSWTAVCGPPRCCEMLGPAD